MVAVTMPPLERSFIDLEIGKQQESVPAAPGPFSLFSPLPTKPSKLKIRGCVNPDDPSSEIPSIPMSPATPVQRKGAKNGQKKKKKKGVTFTTSVRVRLIPSQKEMPEDQKQSIWYTAEEAKAVRDRAIMVVGRMAQNKPLGRNETSRGLETKTPKEHRARRRRIRRIILTVLKAQNKPCSFLAQLLGQERQTMNSLDTWDDENENLASIYSYTSRDCVSEAIFIASIDAEEALAFCKG